MSVQSAAGYLAQFAPVRSGVRSELTLVLRADAQQVPAEKGESASEAYARGYAEGRASFEREAADLRGRLEEAHVRQLREVGRRWAEDVGAELRRLLVDGLEKIEERIADGVASVLMPVLEERVRMQALGALRSTVRELVGDRSAARVKVSGPPELAQELGLENVVPDVVFAEREDGPCEISVEIDGTVVETRLGAWMAEMRRAFT